MKKNMLLFNLLFATVILLFAGCKKGTMQDQSRTLSGSTKQNGTLSTPDVYVAGSAGGQATYWKNGVPVTLPGGAEANGIVVVGTDVYVCGYGARAMYWKNGVPTILSDGSNMAITSGIAVSGSDVYVTGKIGFFAGNAVYWKNGVEVALGSGDANDVFAAANGDIYIANAGVGNPSYWKNGTLVPLTGPTGSYARAIAVNGSDVHVVGTQTMGSIENALYWKNGVLQNIMRPSKTNAMAIAVNSFGQAVLSGTSGTDLNNMHISYWNGIGDLTSLGLGQYVAASTGIAVDQTTDDVYVCGSEYNGQSPPAKAMYWHISSTGGITPVELNSANATALAIALGY